jgi:ABC-type multidrug transport system fused ATPase/permease subunit
VFIFLKRLAVVLDRSAKMKFLFFSVGSVFIAVLEAIGVFLFLPLTQLLLTKSATKIPGSAKWLNHVVSDPTQGRVAAYLAGIVFIVFVVKSFAAIMLLNWTIKYVLNEEARLARRVFSAYMNAPYTFHLQHNSAELQRTLNESLLLVFRRTLPIVLAALADWLTLIAIMLVLVVHDYLTATVAMVYFGLIGLLYTKFIGGRSRVAARRMHRELAERYQQVQEAVRAVKEITVLNRQDQFVDDFYETKRKLMWAQKLLLFFQMVPRYFLDVAFLLGAGVIAVFAYSTRPPSEALASVGIFLVASFRLIAPLNRVMGTATVARSAQPGVEQIISDLAMLDAVQATRRHRVLGRLDPGTIELDDVCFTYEGTDVQVLDHVSMDIKRGEDIGIVGTSGAGKTTLLDVLLGLLDPNEGDIRINGTPVWQCRTDWQLSIGYVPQEIVLVDASVRANVAFGVAPGDVDDSRVMEALRLAQIDVFVASLPEGLETMVGEDGTRLSGGQRQRLGLARALYNKPSVVVFDEATSALDNETEAKIIQTIEDLHGSLTMITVAHRLSTLRHCDRIYFMDGGRVRASGTFDELEHDVPEFARLLRHAQIPLHSVNDARGRGHKPEPGDEAPAAVR